MLARPPLTVNARFALMNVALDSNCASYVIDTFNAVVEPVGDLAIEKKALFQTFVYVVKTFWVTPTVREECAAISDAARRLNHESFFASLFPTAHPTNAAQVIALACAFESLHPDARDCRILAEAVASELNVLISFDKRLVRHLAGAAKPLQLMLPTEFWQRFGVSRGATPLNVPTTTNPLREESWWQVK